MRVCRSPHCERAARRASYSTAAAKRKYPAYAADIAGGTRKALAALRTDPAHRLRYRDFVIAMAYGERPEFDVALASVVAMAEKTIHHEGNGTQ